MADKYCSAKFKTGEELDEALEKAMHVDSYCNRAESAADRAEACTADAVLYNKQELTADQKAQARANIGAAVATTNFRETGEFVTVTPAPNTDLMVSFTKHINGPNTGVFYRTGETLVNLLELLGGPQTIEKNGVTLEIKTDGTYSLSGKHTSSGWTTFVSHSMLPEERVYFPAGTYTVPKTPVGGTDSGLKVAISYVGGVAIGNKSGTFTISEPFYVGAVQISVQSLVTFDNEADLAMYRGTISTGDAVYKGKSFNTNTTAVPALEGVNHLWSVDSVLTVAGNNGDDVVTDVVKFTEQELTNEQKAQARANIGAAAVEDVSDLLQYVDAQMGITVIDESGSFVAVYPAVNTDLAVSVAEYADSPKTGVFYRTGENLLNLLELLGGAQTIEKDGVTLEIRSDGKYSLKGTHSTSGWTVLKSHTLLIPDRVYFPAGTYTVPRTLVGGSDSGLKINFFGVSGTALGNKSGTFTINEPFYAYSIQISVYGSATFDHEADLAMYRGTSATGDSAYRGDSFDITTTTIPALEGKNCLWSVDGVLTVKGKGSTAFDDVASYDEKIASYAERVRNRQNLNALTIGITTDNHVDYADISSASDWKAQYEDMQSVNEYLGRDLIVNMGDILTTGYTDKKYPLTSLVRFGKDFAKNHGRIPIAIVRGNHDDNCYGLNTGSQQVNFGVDAIITPQEWHTILARHSYPDAVFPDGVSDANYFYIDNEHSKIRVIVLDTQDVPMILANETTWKYNSYNCSCVSNAQLNFVAKALQMEGKTNPDEWAVLFISHIPMDTSKANGERMGITDGLVKGVGQFWGIVNAYKNGTTYTFNGTDTNADFPYNINANYSAKGKGEVIALLAGHTHTDNTSDAVGASGSLSRGYRFITVSEFGHADIVVDRNAHEIHVCKRQGRSGYRYSESNNAGVIAGLAQSGNGYNAVDSNGDYVTTWTTY